MPVFYSRLALLPLLIWNLSGGEIRREGAYWVQTITGSQPASAGTRLRVIAPGTIVFRGGSGPALSYACKLKVRAANALDAQRLFRRSAVNGGLRGGTNFVIVSGAEPASEIKISAPRRLAEVALITHGGSVDASDLDGGLLAEAGAGSVTIDRISGDVRIRTSGGRTTLGLIGGLVQCVSGGGDITAERIGGSAFFESGGGDILVRRVDGALRASTAGGGIHVVNAGESVIANTAGGPIQIDRARGLVTARNSGGPIQIGYASSVNCESASGTIEVKSASGSMHASTAMGSIVAAYLAGRPALDSFLSTGSGDITVWIPSHLSVTIRARNEASGNVKTVVSDFPGIGVRSEGVAVVAEGRINGGGPLLRLSGNGGMIFIRKGQ